MPAVELAAERMRGMLARSKTILEIERGAVQPADKRRNRNLRRIKGFFVEGRRRFSVRRYRIGRKCQASSKDHVKCLPCLNAFCASVSTITLREAPLFLPDQFFTLLHPEILAGNDAKRTDRLRAAILLAYGAGLFFPEIAMLRRRNWLPGGVAAIRVVDEDDQPLRTVPASPAVIWAVEKYIGPRTSGSNEDLLFPMTGRALAKPIGAACKRLSLITDATLTSGALQATFESKILTAYPRDPVAYYLVGASVPLWLPAPSPEPSLETLHRMIRTSGHLYKDEKDLWRPLSPNTSEVIQSLSSSEP